MLHFQFPSDTEILGSVCFLETMATSPFLLAFQELSKYFRPPCYLAFILAWTESSFRFFCKMQWKNPNQLSGQPNILKDVPAPRTRYLPVTQSGGQGCLGFSTFNFWWLSFSTQEQVKAEHLCVLKRSREQKERARASASQLRSGSLRHRQIFLKIWYHIRKHYVEVSSHSAQI